MNIFIDTEEMRFVTEKELRQEFEQLKREQPEEYNYTFEQYIQNCTSKNGTLEEVRRNCTSVLPRAVYMTRTPCAKASL